MSTRDDSAALDRMAARQDADHARDRAAGHIAGYGMRVGDAPQAQERAATTRGVLSNDPVDSGPTTAQRYDAAMGEAARDRAQRADPDTARLVENRDQEAAAGKFADAASYQRLIDKLRRDSAETEAHRENAARDAHGRFPFWADRDRPERGPTDRPGAHRRRGERPRRAREERQR